MEEIIHKACNEALSVSMGVKLLSAIPESNLSNEQKQALLHLQSSTKHLTDLMEDLKQLVIPES